MTYINPKIELTAFESENILTLSSEVIENVTAAERAQAYIDRVNEVSKILAFTTTTWDNGGHANFGN